MSGVIGQIRWPNEVMWNDEQKVKQGWLAIVSHEHLRKVSELVEAAKAYRNGSVFEATANGKRLDAALSAVMEG